MLVLLATTKTHRTSALRTKPTARTKLILQESVIVALLHTLTTRLRTNAFAQQALSISQALRPVSHAATDV